MSGVLETARERQIIEAFVRTHALPATAALVPEIPLRLAIDSHGIFQAIEGLDLPAERRFPPFWAFAWPGGQALARYLLDNPSLTAGARVVDIGAGSGIASLAAVMAGAASVTAVDIDPVAAAAIRINADTNGMGDRIATSTEDVLATSPAADLALVSDLVYEPELAIRVGAFLERAAARGMRVLVADRATSRRPVPVAEEVACYAAPLTPALHDEAAEEGRVWRVRTSAGWRADRRGRGGPEDRGARRR